MIKITFCGGAERVTGSCYLVDTGKIQFLVDCGLFQGGTEADKLNWTEFPFDPKNINFVIITHSHIDHIGRLPILVKSGFKGKIYSTKPTKEFVKIFLEDNCNILADMAYRLQLEPLYNLDDVTKTISLFETCDYYQTVMPCKNIALKLYDAGHILGSAITEIKIGQETLVFSGDLGNPPVPILKDTDFVPQADCVIMESTYGDRNHEPFQERKTRLERVVEDIIKKRGTLLIPAFAMERTQEIIYELDDLVESGKIAKIPIYIDSPLAIKATEIYKKYPQYFDEEAKALLKSGKDFFKFPYLKFIDSVAESKEIDRTPGPKIIIAGSGMSTGGRILYHEKRYLPYDTTTLLIIGFQVKGTLGRDLQEKHPAVEIFGENILVKAKVELIDSYSAHADQVRLMYWLEKISKPIKKIFLVHGEKQNSEKLLHKIEAEMGIDTSIPKYLETIEI